MLACRKNTVPTGCKETVKQSKIWSENSMHVGSDLSVQNDFLMKMYLTLCYAFKFIEVAAQWI